MSDIEDQMVRAIQSYHYADGSACGPLLALAQTLAPHIIKELGLKQEWAVGAARVNEDGSERVDDISYDDTDPVRVGSRLNQMILNGARFDDEGAGMRRYLVSRLYTYWAEETQASIDGDLLTLVEEDDE